VNERAALDCRTEVGQEFIADQHLILNRVERAWRCSAVRTPDQDAADIDALLERAGCLCAVVEVKARTMSEDTLRSFGSIIVTNEKLNKGITLAKSLCVPFFFVVGLKGGPIFWWRVCDANGRVAVIREVANTRTQATCNGGSVVRLNAYLSLKQAHRIDSWIEEVLR
jgi:hypothetical protein